MPFDYCKIEDTAANEFLSQIVVNELSSELLDNAAEFDVAASIDEQLTYTALKAALQLPSPREKTEGVIEALAARWARIQGTGFDYTQSKSSAVNQLCVTLAALIAPLPNDTDDLDRGAGPYFLLMPTLKASSDAYRNNIHSYRLNQFIISDDGKRFMPVYGCFERAAQNFEGHFAHVVSLDSEEDVYPALTASEQQRLCRHSAESQAVMEAFQLVVAEHHTASTLGLQLKKLSAELRAGGAHGSRRKAHDGTELGGSEYIAGAAANEGIAAFAAYWNSYTPNKKNELYLKYPQLEDIISRLLAPESVDNANAQKVRYCVELIAGRIDDLLNFEPKLYAETCKANLDKADYPQLTKAVGVHLAALDRAIGSDNYRLNRHRSLPEEFWPQLLAASLNAHGDDSTACIVNTLFSAAGDWLLPMINGLSTDKRVRVYANHQGEAGVFNGLSLAVRHDKLALFSGLLDSRMCDISQAIASGPDDFFFMLARYLEGKVYADIAPLIAPLQQVANFVAYRAQLELICPALHNYLLNANASLRQGVFDSAQNPGGRLCLAATLGAKHMAIEAIAAGASIAARNSQDKSVLRLALDGGDRGFISWLLDQPGMAKELAKDEMLQTLMQYPANYFTKALSLLAEDRQHAAINQVFVSLLERMPLHDVEADRLCQLIESGADIFSLRADGQTIFHLIGFHSPKSLLQVLFDKACNLQGEALARFYSMMDNEGKAPLLYGYYQHSSVAGGRWLRNSLPCMLADKFIQLQALSQIPLDRLLSQLVSESKQVNDSEARRAVLTLSESLLTARVKLLSFRPEDKNYTLDDFKQAGFDAIKQTLPVLSKHQSLAGKLRQLALAIVNIVTCGVFANWCNFHAQPKIQHTITAFEQDVISAVEDFPFLS